jgi:hypothetical protein
MTVNSLLDLHTMFIAAARADAKSNKSPTSRTATASAGNSGIGGDVDGIGGGVEVGSNEGMTASEEGDVIDVEDTKKKTCAASKSKKGKKILVNSDKDNNKDSGYNEPVIFGKGDVIICH